MTCDTQGGPRGPLQGRHIDPEQAEYLTLVLQPDLGQPHCGLLGQACDGHRTGCVVLLLCLRSLQTLPFLHQLYELTLDQLDRLTEQVWGNTRFERVGHPAHPGLLQPGDFAVQRL
ncbi:MAG TPA: hypothetical protein VGP26_14565 [Actinophytocola sp.]|nr:hypothetical protein [Actinophytocola sp.]